MPDLSVIIPTYNAASVLTQTIQALFAQSVPPTKTLELIVVDDGSTDATSQLIQNLKPSTLWTVQYLPVSHHGAAAARNRGVIAANSSLVLFLGADIILRPQALASHLVFHEEHPAVSAAALGYVGWDPRLRPSAFMEWMVHGGPQNSFDDLLGKEEADPRHFFYGSHLSLKRTAIHAQPFSEVFGQYGWEDLEVGRRLAAQGLRLFFLPQARGLHHHFYTVSSICRRQRLVGKNLKHYQRLHPTVPLLPRPRRTTYSKYLLGWYLGGRTLTKLLLARRSPFRHNPQVFAALASLYFWRGINEKLA